MAPNSTSKFQSVTRRVTAPLRQMAKTWAMVPAFNPAAKEWLLSKFPGRVGQHTLPLPGPHQEEDDMAMKKPTWNDIERERKRREGQESIQKSMAVKRELDTGVPKRLTAAQVKQNEVIGSEQMRHVYEKMIREFPPELVTQMLTGPVFVKNPPSGFGAGSGSSRVNHTRPAPSADMIHMRLRLPHNEGLNTNDFKVKSVDELKGKVHVYAIVKDEPIILTDEDANLFPSDQFIIKIKMLRG